MGLQLCIHFQIVAQVACYVRIYPLHKFIADDFSPALAFFVVVMTHATMIHKEMRIGAALKWDHLKIRHDEHKILLKNNAFRNVMYV